MIAQLLFIFIAGPWILYFAVKNDREMKRLKASPKFQQGFEQGVKEAKRLAAIDPDLLSGFQSGVDSIADK